MAKELAHFKNFAKLKDTSVAFNDITVIAGKPGTGKSYVMKMMYAIEESFSTFISDITNLESKIEKLQLEIKDLESLKSEINSLDKKNEQYDKKREIFNSKIVSVKNTYSEVDKLNGIKDEIAVSKEISGSMKNLLNSIFTNINQISNKFNIEYNDVSINYEEEKLHIKERKGVQSKEGAATNVVFVETPLILEFKKFMNKEKGKTPYHIESLLNILDTDYSFTDDEQDKFIKSFTQKSKEIIKGDIESSGESFIFNKEGDKNYDIVNASSGTKSIGLLQYLVTNKALKKGSVLYWEEPEVHLHPEWQLRMVELFIELMNAGVKIVLSTHSPYMCDYLNAISEKEKFSERVSFNLFGEKDIDVVENHILENDEDWNMIQAELLDPLEEIMWEYI